MTTKERESVVNIELSHFFRMLGLNYRPEVIHPGNPRIDVEVKIEPVVITIEAEHGQNASKGAEAISDADRRTQQELAQCTVAVCSLEETLAKNLPAIRVIYTVWRGTGTIDERNAVSDTEPLVSIIRLAPAHLGDLDAAAANIRGEK